MNKSVDFYFDLGSPASYLAWTQLPSIALKNNAVIHWKPMLLGGVFKATGNSSPVAVPAKALYISQDFQRYAKRYGVEFHLNPYFPVNTLQLMRGATAYLNTSLFQDYLNAVFRALWVDKKNMGLPEVVEEVLATAGIDPLETFKKLESDATKDTLKQLTQEAIERGVFGAPTCFVNGEMFFGQDRLEFVEAALNQQG